MADIFDTVAGQPGGGDIFDKVSMATPAPQPTQSQQVAPKGLWDQIIEGAKAFGQGAVKGVSDVGTGIQQRMTELQDYVSPNQSSAEQGLRKIMNNPRLNQQELSQQVAQSRQDFAPISKEHPIAAGAGELVGQVVPTLAIPGGATGGLFSRILASAAQGGAIGAVQPTTQDESVAKNVLTGAATGGVTQGALSAVGKGVNLLRGKLPSNEVTDLSNKFGIRTTLGETTGSPVTQKAETWLESIPVIGLGGFRKAQQQEAQQASKDFLSKYIIDPASPDIMKSNRAYTSTLYDNLNQIVSGIGSQEIPPSQTRQAAIDLLDRYPDIFKKFQDTKREGIIQNIVKGTESTVLDAQGNATKAVRPMSFDEAWTLRDGLGQMIGQAKKKLAGGDVDKTTLGQLSKVYGAVNNDIDSWANSVGRPDVREAINSANDAYKQYVVKYDIIQRAMDKAEGTVGALEMFSPKKFSTALKDIAYKDKELKRFSLGEIQEMTGLANILQVVKRAGQYAENPATGNRWGGPVLGAMIEGASYVAGGSPAALKTAGAMAGTAGIARFLTGTKAGKSLALAASKIEPDSPAMAKIVDQIYSQVPKAATVYEEQQKTPKIDIYPDQEQSPAQVDKKGRRVPETIKSKLDESQSVE